MGLLKEAIRKPKPQILSHRTRPKARRSKEDGKFRCEELEPRLLMTCGADAMMNDPAMMAEKMAVLNLVMPDMATHVAVNSGDWSAPSTWQDGLVPTAGANVLVSEGVAVTFDVAATPALHWLRVDGTLEFSTVSDTSLLVDTVVVSDTGHWIMGTATAPIPEGVHATVTFADLGAIDKTWDPLQFSRGFIALGSVDIHGAATTAYEALATGAKKGDTTLNLAALPLNWKVGDSLILTGTNPYARQDETLKILAIQGNQVTVSPLVFDHLAPTGASVYVTDVTRNVVFQSENSADISRRSHFMIMHSDAVDVEYASFIGLGRTDKSKVIDDVTNISNGGALTPGGGTNVRGRYAFHIHHGGVCMDEAPAMVIGNVVLGSPGWGYVNHQSYVNFINNVAYDTTGAGFVTEAGNEVGSFKGNLAIYAKGSTLTAGRESRQDWGYRGHGFWFQGPGVEVTNNIAVGAALSGFAFTPIALYEPGLGKTVFMSENLVDPSIAGGAATITVPNVPIRKFDGNQAFADYTGVETYAHLLKATHKGRSVLENSIIWAVGGEGLTLNYSAHMTVNNVRVIGNFTKLIRQGININNQAQDFIFNNVRVEGFLTGIQVAAQGKTVINGGYFNNLRNIDIVNARDNTRYVNIQNVQFAILPSPVMAKDQVNIYYRIFYDGYGLRSMFSEQGVVLYNGQYLYALEQAANYVPFPTTKVWDNVPLQLQGKTNQQLMSSYGLCVGGVLAPTGAVTKTGIRGLVSGTKVPAPAKLTLLSDQYTSVLANYQLSYQDSAGVKHTTTVNLKTGWNVITVTINGQKRSFLVFGQ